MRLPPPGSGSISCTTRTAMSPSIVSPVNRCCPSTSTSCDLITVNRRSRRILPDQLPTLQLGPERRRNFSPEGLQVVFQLCNRTHAGDVGRDRGMGENKLQRRRFERHRVFLTYLLDLAHAFKNGLPRERIVVFRAWQRTRRENAAVVAATENDRHLLLFAQRQETVQRVLLEQ